MAKEKELVISPELPCLAPGEGSVQCCNCTFVQRQDEKTILVLLANGGHVKLTSETPIVAVVKPQEDYYQ